MGMTMPDARERPPGRRLISATSGPGGVAAAIKALHEAQETLLALAEAASQSWWKLA
jgi:hypothetical protein